MNPDSRKPAIIILIVVLAVLVGGAAWVMSGGSFTSSDRGEVIATVDDEPIYLRDAAWRVEGLTTAHGATGSLGDEWQDRVFQSLVDDVLIRHEAERLGIVVTDEQLADEILSVQELFGSLAQYEAWLAEQGIDQDELERRIRLQRLGASVYEYITADVTVGDAEVRVYYEENRNRLTLSDGTPASFSDVRDTIRQQLEKEAKDAAYAAWLDERRPTLHVVVLDEDWWRSVQDEQRS